MNLYMFYAADDESDRQQKTMTFINLNTSEAFALKFKTIIITFGM